MAVIRGVFTVAAVVAAALLVAACGGGQEQTSEDERPTIVVTTTVWGDLVARLVEDDAVVEILLQPGQDPHGFAPSARQVASLLGADLVVANGLGLEEGLIGVLEEASADGVEVLELAPVLDPRPQGGDEHHADEGDPGASEDASHHPSDAHADGDHGPEDPHVWLDPVRVVDAVTVLASRLAMIDTRLDDLVWQERGRELAAVILEEHMTAERALATIPEPCRVLVTNHDSLGYFADRYGFDVIGTVIPGTSTTARPNASDFAALVATIRDAGVTAIFAETSESTDLAETLAAEVGDVEVVSLHTGSTGAPGSDAETYEGMLAANVRLLTDALADCPSAAG